MPLKITIFFLMLLSFAKCYLEIYQTKTCNISLIKSENNPEHFTFLNCSRNICETWVTNPQSKICIDLIQNQTSNNWQTCMINCCNDGTLSQTYQTLHKCYSNHIQKDNSFAFYASIIFVLIIVLWIGISLSCKSQYLNEKIYNSPCAICAGKKLTLKTWCDHYMHVSCFAKRYQKKQENYDSCPVCNEFVYNTKLYCKCCSQFMRYVGEKQLQKLGILYRVCATCRNK